MRYCEFQWLGHELNKVFVLNLRGGVRDCLRMIAYGLIIAFIADVKLADAGAVLLPRGLVSNTSLVSLSLQGPRLQKRSPTWAHEH